KDRTVLSRTYWITVGYEADYRYANKEANIMEKAMYGDTPSFIVNNITQDPTTQFTIGWYTNLSDKNSIIQMTKTSATNQEEWEWQQSVNVEGKLVTETRGKINYKVDSIDLLAE